MILRFFEPYKFFLVYKYLCKSSKTIRGACKFCVKHLKYILSKFYIKLATSVKPLDH